MILLAQKFPPPPPLSLKTKKIGGFKCGGGAMLMEHAFIGQNNHFTMG